MAPQYDFKLALTRTIEPTGGSGVELATLEDAARFVALLRPFRQARPHWDFAAELLLKAAETGEESDIEMATAQMERALRNYYRKANVRKLFHQLDGWIERRLWSFIAKRWRNAAYRKYPTRRLVMEMGLIRLISLVPGITMLLTPARRPHS